jgi:hypothetical protein
MSDNRKVLNAEQTGTICPQTLYLKISAPREICELGLGILVGILRMDGLARQKREGV